MSEVYKGFDTGGVLLGPRAWGGLDCRELPEVLPELPKAPVRGHLEPCSEGSDDDSDGGEPG